MNYRNNLKPYLILLIVALFMPGCARVSYPMMDPRDNHPDVIGIPGHNNYVPLGYGRTIILSRPTTIIVR
jgi:hypothetical protein